MTIAEASSRVLHAANDLVELLRLSQGAVHRLQEEVHGPALEDVNRLALDLKRVRRSAEALCPRLERFVAESESASLRPPP
jgi:hypothetical protein